MGKATITKTNQMKHYDKTLENVNLSMYDNMPYNRDVNICNKNNISLESGNVIKSYRCNLKEDPYKLNKNK